MTIRTNARLAGIAYLLYIAAAFPTMLLLGRATSGAGTAAKLATIGAQAANMRLIVVLSLVSSFCAFLLAVTLYAITRDEDRDLALLGFVCRVAEGVMNGFHIIGSLGLLWLAASGHASDSEQTLAGFLLNAQTWTMTISALFFSAGSSFFSYLLLRGRMVPAALAWLGVVASIAISLLLPAQLIGVSAGPLYDLMWIPMLVFEIALALWLIARGVAAPRVKET
jgi:Domain of unknown function (DUF4386)